MPRRPRASLPGVAEHIIQRGNNRQAIFGSNADMKAYINWLKEYAQEFEVSIHTWVLMTNHVHLLCTPSDSHGISLMMQSLGRRYVMYFNRRYQRTGTLWEGRFRSCLVQEETYLMHLYHYIELNPLRAGMVQDPAEYSWSGYQCNGLGRTSDLVTPHPLYLALGKAPIERQQNYRSLLRNIMTEKQIIKIRDASNKGQALGNDNFIADVEALTGKRLSAAKMGRPPLKLSN